jgi:hypothetical protein
MRVQIALAALRSHESKRESNQTLAIERANNLSAGFLGDNENVSRNQFRVRELPYFSLNPNAVFQLVESCTCTHFNLGSNFEVAQSGARHQSDRHLREQWSKSLLQE